jgi:Transcriptional regulators
MLASERHQRILRELELRGSLESTEFAQRTGVSGMTLRRDLKELADRGLLVRVHGGAVSRADTARKSGIGAESAGRPLATIGMVVPSASYYYPHVIRGAKEAARDLGCRLVLAVSDYSADTELRQVERLIAGGVDGLLVTPSAPLADGSAIHSSLTSATQPVVIVERSIDDDLAGGRLESVRSDHAYGAELAVRHLAELGHLAVALAVRETPTASPVRRGHARAVARLGLECFACDIEWDAAGDGPARASIHSFLDRCERTGTRAALVLTDVDAIALVECAIERGLRVPEDLAIVAYDDEVASLASVPLTAVAPAKHDLGRLALSMCFERIAEPVGVHGKALSRVNLLPELNVRESTGRPDAA